MQRLFVLLTGLLLSASAAAGPADSPVGLWKIFDEDSHQPQALVRIGFKDDRYYGVIVDTLVPGDVLDDLCVRCHDERKNQPIKGMVFLTGLRQEGEQYVGGRVLDPDTGDVYHAELHLEDQGHKLVMRGYFGITLFGRSQTWERVE